MIDYPPAGRAPHAFEMAELLPGMRVLNVGCYNGHFERHYFSKIKDLDYYGIDLNEEAIRFAQSFEDGDRFQIAPAEAIPFSDASFDTVFCLDTFEHVHDEQKTAKELLRVLKPGGSLVLSVPHDFLNFLDPDELTRDLRNFVRKYIRKKPLLDHPKHRHYNEEQLREFFKGFEIVRVHRCGTPIFWSLAMFYTALGLPETVTRPLRKLTDPIENYEYALRLPNGFNIMIKARKLPTPKTEKNQRSLNSQNQQETSNAMR